MHGSQQDNDIEHKHPSLDIQMRAGGFFPISHHQVGKQSFLPSLLKTILVCQIKYSRKKFMLTLKPDSNAEGSMDISCLNILPRASCSFFICEIHLSCNVSPYSILVMICQV